MLVIKNDPGIGVVMLVMLVMLAITIDQLLLWPQLMLRPGNQDYKGLLQCRPMILLCIFYLFTLQEISTTDYSSAAPHIVHIWVLTIKVQVLSLQYWQRCKIRGKAKTVPQFPV